MFNNFAGRAIVPVAITMTGFVIVCSIILYNLIKKDLVNDTIYHEASLADTIIKATRYAMIKSDRETIDQIVVNIGQQEGVEFVRIFTCGGVIMISSDPAEQEVALGAGNAGCIGCHSGPEPENHLGPLEKARQFTNADGEKVIAITAPIYNEPACFNGACHYHSPSQKFLGILDIGLSQRTLENTLGTLRLQMIAFCLMILVLSVGGVSALLRVNVLSPIRSLMSYVGDVSRGQLDRTPPRGVEEVEYLSKAFLEMARDRSRCEEELEKYRPKDANMTS